MIRKLCLTNSRELQWECIDYLIGESDSESKQDTAQDEHRDVLSTTIDGGSSQECAATQHHDVPATERRGEAACHQGGHQSSYVERRREWGQDLAVVDAVHVRLSLRRLPEHIWEELLEERHHRGDATWGFYGVKLHESCLGSYHFNSPMRSHHYRNLLKTWSSISCKGFYTVDFKS